MMQVNLSKYLKLASNKTNLVRAIKVALIVGFILNLINNPQLFESGADYHPGRILLTFFVPFCVSLYSSVLANSGK